MVQIPAPIALDEAESFTCVSLDLGLDEEAWLTGIELLPDNEEAVHHALYLLDLQGVSAELADEDGRLESCLDVHEYGGIGAYFPGSGPTLMPERIGVHVPAGARLIVNFHYAPTGAPGEVDQSSVALRWTTEPPDYEALIGAVGNAWSDESGLLPGPHDFGSKTMFWIPPYVEDHTETMVATLPAWVPEAKLFMLVPHMHEVGIDLHATLEHQGETRCLIQDPHWDPDWQLVYTIDGDIEALPTIQGGDRFELRCTYNNGLGNPTLAEALAEYGLDAPIDVFLGQQGLNEMCMLNYGIAVPR